jgi:hypothetical protein
MRNFIKIIKNINFCKNDEYSTHIKKNLFIEFLLVYYTNVKKQEKLVVKVSLFQQNLLELLFCKSL